MSKNKRLLLAAVIPAILLCSITSAFLIKKTEQRVNEFDVASVTCEVHEKTDGNVTSTNGIVTAKSKTSIKVKNTGNVNAYLRVRFVSYWVQEIDGEYQIINKASKMPDISVAEGWIAGEENTYYYEEQVSSNSFTTEFLREEVLLAEEDGYKQVLEVFADAIQAEPTNAVSEVWGVSLDEEGNIVTG